jgi:hypothetical protein
MESTTDKKDKFATMNEEIERVERVMKRRNNSKLGPQTSDHDGLSLARTTSNRGG